MLHQSVTRHMRQDNTQPVSDTELQPAELRHLLPGIRLLLPVVTPVHLVRIPGLAEMVPFPQDCSLKQTVTPQLHSDLSLWQQAAIHLLLDFNPMHKAHGLLLLASIAKQPHGILLQWAEEQSQKDTFLLRSAS